MYYKGIISFVLFFGFIGGMSSCENAAETAQIQEPREAALRNNQWIEVNEQGKPRVDDFQKRKIVFFSNGKYEVHATFAYSGSTFRQPGRYSILDSLIVLKSPKGREIYGTAWLKKNRQLKIVWKNKNSAYGEGTELFSMGNQLNS